jgi:predicted dehydrogenase
MNKVKIYGAGSIGNHLAQASIRMGWNVDMCDIDPEALLRTKNDIYPSRYGEWDNSIGLYDYNNVPVGGYDLVIIGTPPDSHMSLALTAVKEGAKAVLVEKPLCTPDLVGAQELFDEAKKKNCIIFIGYDHAISKSAMYMAKLLKDKIVGKAQTIDVEFREHWGGIFAAHPWLDGPSDTYLGFWERGGGACGEHSHAINLFQMFANAAKVGRIIEVNATMEYVKDNKVNYDNLCLMQIKTENGMIGRVVQDVITQPTSKWARVQSDNGFVEWYCGNKPGVDTVIYGENNKSTKTEEVSKTRPDDFYEEMKHIDLAIKNKDIYDESPISLEKGLDTALVISAAHLSAKNNCAVLINYDQGYTSDALSLLKEIKK